MSVPSKPNVYPQPLVEYDRITFWWLPPESDGGQPIQSYVLECQTPSITVTCGPEQKEAFLPNLSPFTQYSFSIKAVNVIGGSELAFFDTVTTGYRPDPPTSVSVSQDLYTSSSIVTWSAPSYDGGSPVFDYVLRASAFNVNNASVPAKDIFLSAETPFQTTLFNLEDYDYKVEVQAINSCGYSQSSPPVWIYNVQRPGSIVFNGSSSYFAIEDATNPSPFALSTTDFTFEMFFKLSSLEDNPFLFSSSTSTAEVFSLQLQNTGSEYQFVLTYPSASGTQVEVFGSEDDVIGGWHHIAIVGETSLTNRFINIYLDGTLYHTTTSTSYSFTQTLQNITFGQRTTPTSTTNLQGFMTNIRFVTGLAVYISNFVIPQVPLGIINGSGIQTELLMNVTDSGTKLLDSSDLNREITDFGTNFSLQHP